MVQKLYENVLGIFWYLDLSQVFMEMKKYTPNRASCFMRKKYTTFSTEQIVALRSVNKIFPESYDFGASLTDRLVYN